MKYKRVGTAKSTAPTLHKKEDMHIIFQTLIVTRTLKWISGKLHIKPKAYKSAQSLGPNVQIPDLSTHPRLVWESTYNTCFNYSGCINFPVIIELHWFSNWWIAWFVYASSPNAGEALALLETILNAGGMRALSIVAPEELFYLCTLMTTRPCNAILF